MSDLETPSYDPLTPASKISRALGTMDAFSLWFSLGIGLLVLQAGSYLVPGLSFIEALMAIIIGTAIGALLLGLASMIGSDTGLATMANLRPALGVRGASVPAVLNVLQLVGWGAFEIIAMRDAANGLAQNSFGVSRPILWTIGFGGIATLMAIMGPLSLIRRVLRQWGLWILLFGATWLSYTLLAHHDLSQILNRKGDGSLSLGRGIDLVAAMPLSWLPLIADYSRFGRSSKAMFKGSFWGYMLANIWFFALGAAFTWLAKDTEQGMLFSALAMAGGGVALILILIDEMDNIFADIFSAATSFAFLLPTKMNVKIKLSHLSLMFGAICILIALTTPMSRFESFLYLIGSVFTPLYGVLLVDHFIIRKRQIIIADITRLEGAYGFQFGLHLKGFLAWIIGIVSYYAVNTYWPNLGATLPAFVLAAISYWGLRYRP